MIAHIQRKIREIIKRITIIIAFRMVMVMNFLKYNIGFPPLKCILDDQVLQEKFFLEKSIAETKWRCSGIYAWILLLRTFQFVNQRTFRENSAGREFCVPVFKSFYDQTLRHENSSNSGE